MGILNRIVEFVEKWRLVFNVIILLYLIFIWFKMPDLHWVYGVAALITLAGIIIFAPFAFVIFVLFLVFAPMAWLANKVMELNKYEE